MWLLLDFKKTTIKKIMKNFKLIFLFLLGLGFFTSCSSDADDIGPEPTGEGEENLVVQDFIYRTLNDIYLYKDDVPQLANDYFATDSEKNDFLDGYTPASLFDYLTPSKDRFSWLIDDYVELENMLSGISTTSGMETGWGAYPNDQDKVFGVVRYVLPNTSAEANGVERGMIFTTVNGVQITRGNYSSILSPATVEIGLGKVENGSIVDTDETITLTNSVYTENPVLLAKTLNIDGKKIGYLMYNAFTADFDSELNDAFAEFKSENLDEFILDLRYNGGGNIETSSDLASMITGQFTGKVYAKKKYNRERQNYYEANIPEGLLSRFNTKIFSGETINSLNLNKLYVIATGSSASASELIINGLRAYIDVVHVGTQTVGKFQGSTPRYDSPNFERDHNRLNTTHTYAMLPLILTVVNANGEGEYFDGLTPDIEVTEYINEMLPLGDPDEPLLQAALDDIFNISRSMERKNLLDVQIISETGAKRMDYQKMYLIEELPPIPPMEK